ncbi:MAG: hypothetical protein AB7P76_05185 [Candidatus Melainabacteria bacterium]
MNTPEPLPQSRLPAAADSPDFTEAATWLCTNRQTGYRTRIQGTLAEILMEYPDLYALRPLHRPPRDNQGTHP